MFLRKKLLFCFTFFLLLLDLCLSLEIKNVDKSTFKKKIENVYKKEYSVSDGEIEYQLLKGNTYSMIGGSFAMIGILYLAPESFTNWDKSNAKNIFKNWKENVSAGPVVDKDDFVLNYIAHPYCGAVYYMAARSSGAGIFNSFLYSTLLSTFFWEYGIESFAEVPSIQDLIITPIVGSLFGEGFYLAKRHIINNDYKLLNSRFLGKMTIIFMDPITEFTKLFLKDYKYNEEKLMVYSYPTLDYKRNLSYNIAFNFKL